MFLDIYKTHRQQKFQGKLNNLNNIEQPKSREFDEFYDSFC